MHLSKDSDSDQQILNHTRQLFQPGTTERSVLPSPDISSHLELTRSASTGVEAYPGLRLT